jgi:hypothetical protein
MGTATPRASAEAPSWATRLVQDIVSWVEAKLAGPHALPVYAKAKLPDPTRWRGGMIMVSDDVGGFTPAFCDGSDWRRTADRNVIS